MARRTATFCWVLASRRLPLALAAQLIAGETIFGRLYGFMYQSRWPIPVEAAGAALQIGRVFAALALFHRHRAAERAGPRTVARNGHGEATHPRQRDVKR